MEIIQGTTTDTQNVSSTAVRPASRPWSWVATTAAAFASLSLCVSTAYADRGRDDDDRRGRQLIAAPHSHAYGKSLAEWQGIYWRWYYSTVQDPAQSVVDGVQLLPLPAGETISGSGTPDDPSVLKGRLEITIDSETPLVLPLAAWVSERYNNGTPDDADIDNAVFLKAITPHFTIDNRLVITDANEASFYTPPTPFDPIAIYPAPSSYGSIGAISYQSIGVVIRPLSVGVHVLHLDEGYILPGFFGSIFDNTWIITVKKARHHGHR